MSKQYEELTAIFVSERYRSEESNWAIGTLRGGVCVIGNSAPGDLVPGIEYKFVGTHKTHPRYGPQFEFKAFAQNKPQARQGVVAYLKKYAPGIGVRRANDIYDMYGHASIATIVERPEVVARDIKNISEELANSMAVALRENDNRRDTRINLLSLLDGSGIPIDKTIDLAMDTWDIAAPEVIRRDPFQLLELGFPGCGFLTVDQLYKHLGLPLTAIRRQVMACWYVVHSDRSGSTWMTAGQIGRRMGELIDSGLKVDESIVAGVKNGYLVVETEFTDGENRIHYAGSGNGAAEVCVAKRLRRLMA